jgi:hypothetical protein
MTFHKQCCAPGWKDALLIVVGSVITRTDSDLSRSNHVSHGCAACAGKLFDNRVLAK